MTTNGETETGASPRDPQLSQQRVEVLVRSINSLLILDPKPEAATRESKPEKRSFTITTYIRKIDRIIDRIDELLESEVLALETLEKVTLYRGRLEERVIQLSGHLDYEEGADDSASNELAIQRRELLIDDVDHFLRISPLNVPTNRRQALIDKGDRYIERLENLGYFHLQDAETLRSIRNYKRDIQKLIGELCRGSDGPNVRGNTSWSSDSKLNEQRMEILFQDIELFVSVAPSSVSVSRRYATVQKGDKLIEKLLQYGYYQVLDKETLQIIQTHKQNLENTCSELSKLIDEQPASSHNNHSGNFVAGFRRQHSSGFERQHSAGFERNY